jgi:protein-S-isoprenylcysteine O-methyltransferase Ste14
VPHDDSRPDWKVKVPPPIWAVLYIVIAALFDLAYPWKSLIDLSSRTACVTFIIAGAAVAFWARGLFARRSTTIIPTGSTSALVTTGPYRHSRNPMYVGMTLVTLGIAFLVGAMPMFAVPVALFVTVNRVFVPFEEAKMRRTLGAPYTEYLRRVRRWL